jgi:hypothetical protein
LPSGFELISQRAKADEIRMHVVRRTMRDADVQSRRLKKRFGTSQRREIAAFAGKGDE